MGSEARGIEPPEGDLPQAAPPKYVPPSKLGLAFMVGGGYEDFANTEMRDRTNGGGAWNFRFVAGTRSILGVEGAYVGSARGFQSLGVGFSYGYKALMLDVRGTYSPTYYNNLLQGANGNGTLNTWGVGGQIGFGF